MAIVRVRQHVNPLAQKYQQPSQPPLWAEVFANPELPLHLDIGCARGRFVLKMAEVQPEWNFLGLEIREPLVIEANRLRDEKVLRNLHYVFCNANLSLRSLLTSLPPQTLQRVSIQFPDPWFKKRHQKRRVVQPELVSELAEFLPTGAEIFLQSDVREVAVEMGDRFQENPAFVQQGDWLTENPLPVPTEREIATQKKGEPVYRMLFVRK